MDRGYKGHPDKQKNPKAKNIFQPRHPTNDEVPSPPQKNEQAPVPQKRNNPAAPAMPPKPRMAHNKPPPKESIVEKESTADSFFNFNMHVRERNIKVTQQPNLSTYPRLVDLTFNQLTIDDTNLNKLWTREMFQYYCASLLWLRIIHLKEKQIDELTASERQIIDKTDGFSFNVPEPIRLYMNGLGEVQTKAGQHIFPSFPPLPNTLVDQTPGYFSNVINANSHNLYEELPCLGTIITLLQASLIDVRPLPQPDIPVLPADTTPTQNLCFWHRISPPRLEASQSLQSLGITPDQFPNSPRNTGFNFQLLKLVSNILADTHTFKIHPVTFTTLQEQGYLAQTIITRPTPDNDNTMVSTTCNVQPTSLNCEQSGTFGMAVAFGYQLFKESFEEDDHLSWSCVDFGENPVPDNWIATRNDRRNIPQQYTIPVFNGMTNNMADFLLKSVQQMVKTKR